MTLPFLDDVLGGRPRLVLPIRPGLTFEVVECSSQLWLRFQDALANLTDIAATVSSEQLMHIARTGNVTDLELYQAACGDTWQQMIDAGLSHHELMFCAQTAWLWQLGLHGAAAAYWTSGGKAPAPPNQTGPTPTTTTSTGEASTPPSSAPGSTTTSPTTSSPSGPRGAARAKGRRGPRSSRTAA